ncbi:hypothetical protein J6590_090030 [Homalodisca vitripennis]|nr:hypothetical protein J6590_090030 [Homalodisca vitripennis]
MLQTAIEKIEPVEQNQPEKDYESTAETSHDLVEVCNAIGLKLGRLLNKMRNKLTQPRQHTIENYFAKIRDLAEHLHQENLILKSKITVHGLGRKVTKPKGDKCTAQFIPKTRHQTPPKIRRIYKIRNNGVALEVENADQLPKQEGIKELKCIVDIKKPKIPRGIGQNNEQEDCTLAKFRPLFKTGPKNKPTNKWICEDTAETRAGRVFIDWASCQVTDHYITKSEVYVCGHCAATGHETKACPHNVGKSKAKPPGLGAPEIDPAISTQHGVVVLGGGLWSIVQKR